MKINLIGDTHGADIIALLKSQLERGETSVVVGDYFDSFFYDREQQLRVFIELIELKKLYPTLLILLLGNHDVQYFDDRVQCSGYSQPFKFKVKPLFDEHLELFDMVYQVDDVIISHSGIMQGFLDELKRHFYHPNYRFWMMTKDLNIAEFINFVWQYEPNHRELFYKDKRFSSLHKYSGLIWVRPKHLLEDLLIAKNQVVGHTHTMYDVEDYVHFIDCLLYGDYLQYDTNTKEFNLLHDENIAQKPHKKNFIRNTWKH